ncbi:MAG: hypothetical protein ACOYJK_03540 [Prevotella sp.]|jgi:hypothetical protein
MTCQKPNRNITLFLSYLRGEKTTGKQHFDFQIITKYEQDFSEVLLTTYSTFASFGPVCSAANALRATETMRPDLK